MTENMIRSENQLAKKISSAEHQSESEGQSQTGLFLDAMKTPLSTVAELNQVQTGNTALEKLPSISVAAELPSEATKATDSKAPEIVIRGTDHHVDAKVGDDLVVRVGSRGPQSGVKWVVNSVEGNSVHQQGEPEWHPLWANFGVWMIHFQAAEAGKTTLNLSEINKGHVQSTFSTEITVNKS